MSNRWSGGADLTLTLCLQYSPFTSSAMLITGCQCLSGMLVLLCLIYCRSEYYKWWWAAMQWHQNEFERGGDTDLKWSAGKKKFGLYPSTILAITISRFGKNFRDDRYSLVSFLFAVFYSWCPRAQPFVKVGGAQALHPSTQWSRRLCSNAMVLTVDLEFSCSKCVLRPNVCMQMTTWKTLQKSGLAKRRPI